MRGTRAGRGGSGKRRSDPVTRLVLPNVSTYLNAVHAEFPHLSVHSNFIYRAAYFMYLKMVCAFKFS